MFGAIMTMNREDERMIEQEIRRLQDRIQALDTKILPQLEHRTEFLFSQIMPLPKGSGERDKLEHEYAVLSKELRLRSDERHSARQELERLQQQQAEMNAKPKLTGRRR